MTAKATTHTLRQQRAAEADPVVEVQNVLRPIIAASGNRAQVQLDDLYFAAYRAVASQPGAQETSDADAVNALLSRALKPVSDALGIQHLHAASPVHEADALLDITPLAMGMLDAVIAEDRAVRDMAQAAALAVAEDYEIFEDPMDDCGVAATLAA